MNRHACALLYSVICIINDEDDDDDDDDDEYRKPAAHGDDSTAGRANTSDPYSQIVHCLIYRQDGLYGFAEPYFIHRTLKDLVLHYRETSLFEHNDELDTTLRIPVGTVDAKSLYAGPSAPPVQVAIYHKGYIAVLELSFLCTN